MQGRFRRRRLVRDLPRRRRKASAKRPKCTRAVVRLQASPGGLQAQAELVKALYHMADLYFVFARETLLSSPALEQVRSGGVGLGVGAWGRV